MFSDYVDECAKRFRDTATRMGAAVRAEKGLLADRVFEALQAMAPDARQEVVLGRECGYVFQLENFPPSRFCPCQAQLEIS